MNGHSGDSPTGRRLTRSWLVAVLVSVVVVVAGALTAVVLLARSGGGTPAAAPPRVTVGFDNPNGQPVSSAVLHLVRFGSGTDTPWEVVGTQDTTLTLTTPAYGVTVRSSVTVGGLITGVDESLRVQIRQLGLSAPIATTGGVPACGDKARGPLWCHSRRLGVAH